MTSVIPLSTSRGARPPLRCVIVGAGGYTGAELAGILLRHPQAEIVGLFGSERAAGGSAPEQTLGSQFPALRQMCDLPIRPMSFAEAAALAPDAVFLATPHAVSHDLAPSLLESGAVVFDLSGAFRLQDAALYPSHYGFEHRHEALLNSAVYGLPELHRAAIRSASLVAVPGCYPTSAILPLAPLVSSGAIAPGRRPIIDSTSGVSGAGRRPVVRALFCEVSQQPYDVLRHRHGPEINEHAGCEVIFTPHLGPYDRGILSTIHVELAAGWTEAAVRAALARSYSHEPFIRLLPQGEWPSVAGVRGTNFCDIALAADEARSHLILVSAIDNLVKGAAGQAVQCLNIRFDLPEITALGAHVREGALA